MHGGKPLCPSTYDGRTKFSRAPTPEKIPKNLSKKYRALKPPKTLEIKICQCSLVSDQFEIIHAKLEVSRPRGKKIDFLGAPLLQKMKFSPKTGLWSK